MDKTNIVSASVNSPSSYYGGMLVGLGLGHVKYWEAECTRIGRFRAGPFVVRSPVSDLHIQLIEYIMNEELDQRYGLWSFKHF